MSRKRVAVLISGRGSNMAALIEAAKDKNYPAEIVLVISNRPDAGGLGLRAAAGHRHRKSSIIPCSARTAPRSTARLQAALEEHSIDSSALPASCRLLTPGFRRAMAATLLNIHPSLLPAFKGLDTHSARLKLARRSMARPCILWWRKSIPVRSLCRARWRCGRRYRSRRSPRACSRSSTRFTRWRSNWWRKAACASSTAAA